jgi:hypothetical protein
MRFLERSVGPLRIRAWGLLVNFLMNTLALVGLALWLRDQSGLPLLLLGTAGTLICIVVLANPDRSNDFDHARTSDAARNEVKP